ncbi:ThuA domain-containing protein [Clavibacter michiganensis]|uniref:ThuA domain-containing protein n=1 Tax=Clavibacter michiganensis TaxID=28447 RepID=UPI0026DCA33D|nr:ThuA domain-containing protein [Clavibacter michiganensis]MDO4073891.1 ThuA domain-containing protein [Clavibacter michiganensis]MDO4129535.1 ThuA domain-containing protein [Clavibacter michiganensis]MDO4135462.1 ThuA domain-containing protein [Clavibacter michiganensis]
MDIVVWNENVHESRGDATVLSHYPDGIHQVVADGLRELLGDDARVSTATLQEDQHGLTEERLASTDVLYWWGHVAHGEVSDEVVARVIRHVHAGMGLVVLHSGHYSKVFTRLMGTTCSLKWRNDGERELVWTIAPQHPIAEGIPHPIVIDRQEMYGEQFDIPRPDEEVFLSTFAGGEVFRSGVAYHRGRGRVFYFSPGDQEYPVYHHPDIRRVLANAARWVAPTDGRADLTADEHPRDWFLAR